MLKKIILIFFFVSVLETPVFAEELNVAVAANVQYAFQEIRANFELDTGITINAIFGSSGKFSTQIINGAPFDVFLSADTAYPEYLFEHGFARNKPEIYGYGTLVLWSQNNLDLSKGMQILVDPLINKIALASPGTAPYGLQAVSSLKFYGLYKQVQNKLVYGESVAQTNLFITSGSSDIGFTAKAVVLAPIIKNRGTWIEINKESYKPIAQGVVILKYAENNHLDSAQTFYDYLFSKKSQDIFKSYGYILPKKRSVL